MSIQEVFAQLGYIATASPDVAHLFRGEACSAFVSLAREITYARMDSASRRDKSFEKDTIPFGWSKPSKTTLNHRSFASVAEYRRSGKTPPLTATSPWHPEQN